jgi:hypothetical protein
MRCRYGVLEPPSDRRLPRFAREDVPHGLVFNAALARISGIGVPVTDSGVAVLSTLCARFRCANRFGTRRRVPGNVDCACVTVRAGGVNPGWGRFGN